MSLQNQTDALEWLQENHPPLHEVAELDREWIWLPVDLRGAENKAIRESIGRKGAGFRFAPNGHPLPSGKIGTWGHSCEHPTPNKRRHKAKGGKPKQQPKTDTDEMSAEELAAFLA